MPSRKVPLWVAAEVSAMSLVLVGLIVAPVLLHLKDAAVCPGGNTLEATNKSAVMVLARHSGDHFKYGTGQIGVYKKTLGILTAAHVVEGFKEVEIWLASDSTHAASKGDKKSGFLTVKVLLTDPKLDLAWLDCPEELRSIAADLHPTKDDPALDSQVILNGCSAGYPVYLAKGYVARVKYEEQGRFLVYAPCYAGGSGSSAFVLCRGGVYRLQGVLIRGVVGGCPFVCVGPWEVHQFLIKVDAGFRD